MSNLIIIKKVGYVCATLETAERVISQCNGKLYTYEGGIVHELPVSLENNGQVVAFVLPLELTDQQVKEIFQVYGQVKTITKLYFSEQHRFKFYNRKIMITFSKITKRLQLFFERFRIKSSSTR